jgi:hypothetical protein
METLEARVIDALSKGWIMQQWGARFAVLTHPGTSGMDVASHIVLLVLSAITCGIALPIWLALYAYYTYASVPAQTLTLTEVDGTIIQEVIRS